MRKNLKMTNKIIHPLKPIYNESSKVLILGSFPSQISRKEMMYYANPTNRFWKVMEVLFKETILDKEEFLLRKRIALWDVVASCKINGSSDASISDVEVNDIASLIKDTNITTIFTTGKKASDLFQKFIHIDINHIALPSTSSANAKMSIDDLVQYYKIVKECLDEKD